MVRRKIPAIAVYVGGLEMSADLSDIGGTVSYMEETDGIFCCLRCALHFLVGVVTVVLLLKWWTE